MKTVILYSAASELIEQLGPMSREDLLVALENNHSDEAEELKASILTLESEEFIAPCDGGMVAFETEAEYQTWNNQN